MPRFYFDVQDGEQLIPDEDGSEFAGLEDAREEALATLGEIARDELPDGDRRDFVIRVREGSPEPVLTATLMLRVERAQ